MLKWDVGERSCEVEVGVKEGQCDVEAGCKEGVPCDADVG